MAIPTYRMAASCVLLLIFTCHALGAVNPAAPLPFDPHVKVGKLDNGLTYYIRKNGKPEKRVELRLVVKAGSILEDDDQQGLAHFTEHMAFNGSRHFGKHELVSFLQSMGVKFGADLNAYTSFDETVYILPIPTDNKENLEKGLLVLEDWASGVTMDDAAIDQERNIVLEEARLGKGADDRMNRVLLPEEFNGSRYAERLPIGKEEILKSFPHEAIRRFYADWYRPDLMAVIVVGDVEPDQAEKMIQAHFSHLKNPAKERPRDYVKIPPRDKSNSLVITDQEATDNKVLIQYPIQEIPPDTTIADFRQERIKGLYVSMLGRRLFELTQQANPPFLRAYSGLESIAPHYKSFSSAADIGRNGASPAIVALVQESERVQQFGFNASEFERAKKDMLRSFERQYNERDKTESAVYVGKYISNFLEQSPIPGIEHEYAYATELVPGISLDEVNRYAQEILPHHATKLVAYMGSSKEKDVPLPTNLLDLVNSAEGGPVTAKVEKPVSTGLMSIPPKGGRIVAEKLNEELGIVELSLSNGIKVILKPTDFKNDQVLIGATRFGGQSLFDEQDMFNARYTIPVVMGMGLDTYTPAELSKVLAGKSVSLGAGLDFYTDNINGSSGSAEIETLLQLLYLRMTSPRKDETLFNAYINKSQDWAKNKLSNPDIVFHDMVYATVNRPHPRLFRIARPEDFSRVDLDRAVQIYRERFTSAKGLTFVIVGSFELDKIRPLIATYLASLPTDDITASFRDLNIRPVTGVIKKEVHIGVEPKSEVTFTFTGPATYSLEEDKRFQMLLEVMNIRIIDILREKMSLIYSGDMSGNISRVPYTHYQINIGLPCGPENVDKVIAAMLAEIERIKNDGPQQADVDKVKQNWLLTYRIAMHTNGKWFAHLKTSVLYGTDLADILTEENRINAITTEEIKETAKRYLNSKNYVQMVRYPEM